MGSVKKYSPLKIVVAIILLLGVALLFSSGLANQEKSIGV